MGKKKLFLGLWMAGSIKWLWSWCKQDWKFSAEAWWVHGWGGELVNNSLWSCRPSGALKFLYILIFILPFIHILLQGLTKAPIYRISSIIWTHVPGRSIIRKIKPILEYYARLWEKWAFVKMKWDSYSIPSLTIFSLTIIQFSHLSFIVQNIIFILWYEYLLEQCAQTGEHSLNAWGAADEGDVTIEPSDAAGSWPGHVRRLSGNRAASVCTAIDHGIHVTQSDWESRGELHHAASRASASHPTR